MILIRFNAVDSIIAYWLIGLHEGNTSRRSERPKACLRSFMTVVCLISIQVHRVYMDMSRTSRCTRNPWASKLLQVNTVCRWRFTSWSANSLVQILCFASCRECHPRVHYTCSFEHLNHWNLWHYHITHMCFSYKAETSGWNSCNKVDRQNDSVWGLSLTFQRCTANSPSLLEWWDAQ